MLKNLYLISCLAFSLVFTAAHSADAATPNLEEYDFQIQTSTNDEDFIYGKELIEEIDLPGTQLSTYGVAGSTNSVLQAYTLIPEIQYATQWGPLQTITDPKKEWNITFNSPVNVTEENTYKVKILDESGNEVVPIVSLNASGIKIKPGDPYKSGKIYTLLIKKDLDSHKGIQLGKDIYLQFVYEAPPTEQKPEITEVTDIYSALFVGLKNLDDTIFVGNYSKDSKVVFAELDKLLREHPEIFYFQHRGSLFYSDGRFEVKYAYAKDTVRKMQNEVEQAVSSLYAATVKPGMSDYEKVKAIHDYVVLHTAYDYENYKNNTVPEESYSIYGLLVNNTAVCEGYAETMVYLLNRIGIETIYVRSSPSMNHAWNKVKIDGEWYNLDATWDDPVPDREGIVGYGYFLVSDSQLAKTHSWSNTGLPKAGNKKYEYMSNLWTSDSENGWVYYANKNDNIKLYKMREDGTSNQKIADVRANELVVHDGWIYFSNYSHSGYLFKIRTDGGALTQITDFLTEEIFKEGNTLYFTDKKAGKNYRLGMNE